MKKQDILKQVREARDSLVAAINGLPPDAMLKPGAAGLWSIKDMLAHISAWESELVTALAKLGRQMPALMKIEDIDAWNEEQYHINARRSLEAVLEDFHGVHRHLLKTIEDLDERTLTDPRQFRWMEGEPLWYLIAENAFWHEQEHAEQIRRWREAQGL